MSEIRGIPLLSGPPPPMDSGDACRKCGKEFNVILNRSRKCNHCGYSYCHNCTDYQALMPRSGQDGHGLMNVCGFCIEFLTITASGKGQLKTMPLSKLKKYVEVYNIKMQRAVEKDDLIDGIMEAKKWTGCLPPENENYYRKYSVPDKSGSGTRPRGFFSRSGPSSNTPPAPPPRPPSQRPTNNFARPDLAPDNPPYQQHYGYTPQYPPHHPQPQYHTPPPVPPRPPRPPQPPRQSQPYSYPPPPHAQSNPPTPPQATRPQHGAYPPYQRPSASRSTENLRNPNARQTPPRTRAASAAPPATPPPPSLDELLDMPPEAMASLSIGTLKAILFTNHVNAGMILEKGELVGKVQVLVDAERRDRERQRALEQQEEAERIEQQRVQMEEYKRIQREREERIAAEKRRAQGQDAEDTRKSTDDGEAGTSDAPAPPLPPKTRGTASDLERTGLCVICQDDEANIAIVDCGHLAMCRGCSDLVMASSKECPLCRTRIVTEARLLRIFKT
ncbi:hypothetical protein Hypma_013949 [Hypsizygus marmoreus]|uniref:RING-type domain-containing protein n=1 Tax=Hypsizygus marmoreus TaxID=39966 RepID=A0A369KFV8_HYPMA|nr:hypothetical protein Hypma_013949 [Hypsizygus marmoreus]